jgi:hypothetical protein
MNSYSSPPPAPRRPHARQWPEPAQGTRVTAGSPCPRAVSLAWPNSSGSTPAAHERAGDSLEAKRAQVERYLRALAARRYRLVKTVPFQPTPALALRGAISGGHRNENGSTSG